MNAGERFTDPSFRPVESSLFDDDEGYFNIARYMPLEWKRLGDIYPEQRLFGKKIQLRTVL